MIDHVKISKGKIAINIITCSLNREERGIVIIPGINYTGLQKILLIVIVDYKPSLSFSKFFNQ